MGLSSVKQAGVFFFVHYFHVLRERDVKSSEVFLGEAET